MLECDRKLIRMFVSIVIVGMFLLMVLPQGTLAEVSLLSEEEESEGMGLGEKISQWLIDSMYGEQKVSYETLDESKSAILSMKDEIPVLVKIKEKDIPQLKKDFDVSNVTITSRVIYGAEPDAVLVKILIPPSQVVQSWWDRLWGKEETLADKDYVKAVYKRHIMALIEPVEAMKKPLLKKNELGVTTYDLCEKYGVMDYEYNGSNVSVAVLDTGCWVDEKVFPNVVGLSAIAGASPLDDNGHGSHCAGIIGGANVSMVDPEMGEVHLRGIAPNVTIYSIKVLDMEGSGQEEAIVRGIEMSVELEVDIISMSLGGRIPRFSALYSAIKYAVASGIVVVCASGNSAERTSVAPACWDGTISVGSLMKYDRIAWYSCLGADVLTVGTDVTSPTIREGRFCPTTLSGTSMATPVVTGLIALFLQAHPDYKNRPIKVKEMLVKTGDYENPDRCISRYALDPFGWNDYAYSTPEIDYENLLLLKTGSKPDKTMLSDDNINWDRVFGTDP